MKYAFDTEVWSEIDIEICRSAVDSVGEVVGAGIGKANSDLEVRTARCGWSGLSAQHGCRTDQAQKGKNLDKHLRSSLSRQTAVCRDPKASDITAGRGVRFSGTYMQRQL